jgi:hypothetical protein
MTVRPLAAALALAAAAIPAAAQTVRFERLPPDVLEVTPPTERIRGTPGGMTARQRECRTLPLDAVRRRIVDVAVQEWAFFGFPIRDEAAFAALEGPGAFASASDAGDSDGSDSRRRMFERLSPEESARVATSVAGYWAVTPQATMMIGRQNASWNRSDERGRADPWSAAFVSWVMCEAGLGQPARFERAIAHHVYIDQAIRARDGQAPQAAFVAHDAGAAAVAPGDVLCAARRPIYRAVAERRRQLGVGARTHCDIVVKVDEPGGRIFAIGGNVGRAVSLKLLRAVRGGSGHLQAASLDEGRPVFAHLKLRAQPIEAHALDNTPTLKALGCAPGVEAPVRIRSLLPALDARVAARRC